MQIKNKDEALGYVDTIIRENWRKYLDEHNVDNELGKAEIDEEKNEKGHMAWSYYIEGIYMSTDGRRRWLLDTGELVETTINQDENTIEKAYLKTYGKELQSPSEVSINEAKAKAEDLLRKTDPNYSGTFGLKEVDGVGYLVWQEVRGGGSIIIGNDGGVLFSNMTGIVSPEDLIQAYKDGKRSDEAKFGGSGSGITEEQVRQYVQNKFNEEDSTDRIEDRGFAYYIDTQPREYLDTKDDSKMKIGNGPIVVLRSTGDVFSFSSNPLHMFGKTENRVGVNTAKTAEEFQTALNGLKAMGDHAALNPETLAGNK
ncbi:hypothetical protein KC992_00285 [Candidatus Saccharibacteria bacterium]|nr:hypothetical protein [Candidatus Saccharibacteria bacterium]